jgi:hypothetical protein
LLTRHLSSVPGLTIGFDVADLTGRLPEAEASVDITICLYSVLSHLPVADLAHVSKEIARVAVGVSAISVTCFVVDISDAIGRALGL